MIDNTVTCQLEKVVFNASNNISMFRNLYGENISIKSIDDFRNLPITSRSDYACLQDVSEVVTEPWDMAAPVAPWNWQSSKFPLPVLHSSQEELSLEERTKYLMDQMGLGGGQVLTLLVDTRQIYAASDFADILIYLGNLGYPCQMLLLDSEPEKVINQRLTKVRAESLFLFSDRELGGQALPSCIRQVVSFNFRQKPKGCFQHLDVFHLDEIPLIAVNTGDGRYRCPDGHFFFEKSDKGTLLITTLKQDFAPFIRYDTGFKATIDGNFFRLDHKL